ncbi:MAG: Glutamyl-tRNA(Gln) amidotransferase subunit A [Parcubacteria group bacterium GW2011_GWA2_47_8b]|uniref:Glutamyl-tRNA(Gln) amidotransferase subunit A n=3 Tax=Parcubacteria group TaxID=1794811 RepID=A0A0G1T5N7_9BACT|nr:MAG: Glutamyl-tRNA(Gln) amidotransferase subunit A [Candidatus Giovannonibacteria bacterium GW2011_GWB1_47_6b]KKU85461.1 MAG: Glutamyl-tRNA(Gln) amidotransferase subunit A [Parcubacteria group bacterium GW2011_GWA2_47_8b]KKU94781.1 MAG: Glutamyl-tRNA(Gln) amidotransferase subunit A [Parcubacteria group bacterium GW2011_GWA1_48_11b]OGY64243.1 MAG: aspartyl/glutamyl-tRNA amidotransferase subunit A [Candidatus Harrisonbacteria bacterium RIFCSPHIGHO2_12_FULL_48_16]OGY69109.1 MAG: aspartyl/glutam
MHLHDLTIKKFHDGLLKKEFSAFDVAKGLFDFIEDKDKEIGAYLSLAKDTALKQAEKVDIAVAKQEPVDALAGVPLAIKDAILIEGQPATAGSKILENYRAAYDATVISKLKSVGAVFLGKTNLDEFAMGSSTENSAFKVTKNPHDLTRVPGGSSGGSAAAVAAHMAVAALGSDTGGSIRQPASLCGVVGLKTTYGAVSRHGLIAMASSLDQIGPIAKTVDDAALLFKAIAGKDQFDSTSVDAKYGPELTEPKLEDIKKMTIGVPSEYFVEGLDPAVSKAMEEAMAALKSLGIKFKEISLPHTKYALSCYYIIMPAEVSSNLARFDGIRYGVRGEGHGNLLDLYKKSKSHGFGAETKRRIILGTYVLSSGYYDAYYAKAQKVRRLIKNDFDEAFNPKNGGVDVIFTPVAPTPAFKIGEKTDDPLAMYLSDIFTLPVNLAGLPAVSIPVKQASNAQSRVLPVGFQLIGKPWREADILGIGHYYEQLH